MAFSLAESRHTATRAIAAFLVAMVAALSTVRKRVISDHNTAAKSSGHSELILANPDDSMGIVREARMFGAAIVTIAITVVVVNEVLTVDTINNSSGPFAGVINDLETTGVAAMGLLVVGLLVVAGRVVMGFMGGNGGGGF